MPADGSVPGRRGRTLGRVRGVFLLAILGACGTLQVRAEPAFAVRTGYRCSACHTNPTGGGIRTAFGSIYTQTILPWRTLPGPVGRSLLPANPDARFAVGANLRGQYLSVDSRDRADTASFEVPEANVFLEARLIPERLTLYVDETIGPGGASSREVFGLFSFGKHRAYVKAGKFLPPYGWRLPDDDAFIRQFSGFNYRTPDNGIEVGAEHEHWSVHLAATNGSGGSDDNRAKRFTLLTTRRFEKGRLGVSASNDIGDDATTTHAGLLGGANFGRLALLAEGDWVETSRDEGTEHRLLGFIEADLLLTRGVNLKLAHDWIDPDRDVRTDDRVRDSLGIEFIPYPFVQLRWFVRRSDGPPQVDGARDVQVDIEAHIFF